MPNITAISSATWNKPDGSSQVVYNISLDGGALLPCYDAQAAPLKVGDSLPAGWQVEVSKSGKEYIKVPRQGGGGGKAPFVPAWANTEAGERFVQERMDRRTALMQAVVWHGTGTSTTNLMTIAGGFYTFLRNTSGAVEPTSSPSPAPAPEQATAPESGVRPAPWVEQPQAGPTGGNSLGAAELKHEHDYGLIPDKPGWEKCLVCGVARRFPK